jgi:hypothetical protein
MAFKRAKQNSKSFLKPQTNYLRENQLVLLTSKLRHNLVEDFRNLKWSFHYPTSNKDTKLLREELIRYFARSILLDTVIWSIE